MPAHPQPSRNLHRYFRHHLSSFQTIALCFFITLKTQSKQLSCLLSASSRARFRLSLGLTDARLKVGDGETRTQLHSDFLLCSVQEHVAGADVRLHAAAGGLSLRSGGTFYISAFPKVDESKRFLQMSKFNNQTFTISAESSQMFFFLFDVSFFYCVILFFFFCIFKCAFPQQGEYNVHHLKHN